MGKSSDTGGRNPARRRQRSVRVTVSVASMALATVLVLAALPTRSAFWLSLAAVAAIVLAWGSLRIMWTEVLQTRRESAREQASTAAAYKSLFAERAADHAEFTSAMTERLAESQLTLRETQGELGVALSRADHAETGRRESDRRLADVQTRVDCLQRELATAKEQASEAESARERVLALETELDVVRAERAALAGWQDEGGDAALASLISFEQTQTSGPTADDSGRSAG